MPLIGRRKFLADSGRAALLTSLLSMPALTQGHQTFAKSKRNTAWDSFIDDLEQQIPKVMKETVVPGLSIVIVKDAKLAWRRAFGVKDNTSKRPVDDGTVFEAASMTKPVFAYAVMKLCEKGVMNLDTPLTKYTPDRFLQGDSRLDLITARHVLSHTSGFQDWRSEKEPLKIHFTPGEKWLYSGEGYSYLQSVVAHVTGESLEPYMRANVFVPFGMASSGFIWNEIFEKRMARPHDAEGRATDNNRATEESVARYGAAGELRTTPTDYAKFLIEVIDPKPADAFRLSKASLDKMLRPQVKVESTKEYSISWALGWRIARTSSDILISHGGYNRGFQCMVEGSVQQKAGYVIMTNGENGGELLKKLAPAISLRLYPLSGH